MAVFIYKAGPSETSAIDEKIAMAKSYTGIAIHLFIIMILFLTTLMPQYHILLARNTVHLNLISDPWPE